VSTRRNSVLEGFRTIESESLKDRIQCGFKYGKMGKRFRRGDRDVKLSIVSIKVVGDGRIRKKIS